MVSGYNTFASLRLPHLCDVVGLLLSNNGYQPMVPDVSLSLADRENSDRRRKDGWKMKSSNTLTIPNAG